MLHGLVEVHGLAGRLEREFLKFWCETRVGGRERERRERDVARGKRGEREREGKGGRRARRFFRRRGRQVDQYFAFPLSLPGTELQKPSFPSKLIFTSINFPLNRNPRGKVHGGDERGEEEGRDRSLALSLSMMAKNKTRLSHRALVRVLRLPAACAGLGDDWRELGLGSPGGRVRGRRGHFSGWVFDEEVEKYCREGREKRPCFFSL